MLPTSRNVLPVVLLLVAPLAGLGQQQHKNSPRLLKAFEQPIDRARRATVEIRCDDKPVALGTIVGADGWILTKASELNGKIVCRLQDGRRPEARVVGVHEKNDLALLRIDLKDLPVVDWVDGKSAAVGNWVASAGMGSLPVAVGVVSVAVRELPRNRRDRPHNPTTGGYLGIGLAPDAAGAKVSEVQPKSAADKAGLLPNDVIVRVDSDRIDDMEGLLLVLQKRKPGQKVALLVKRGDNEIRVEATLAKRPRGRSDFQNSLGSDLSDRRAGFATILQHDSVLHARQCGGPLVDLDGKAVGINIARAGRTETYALPSEIIRPLLADLKSGKFPPSPALIHATTVGPLHAELERAEAAHAAAMKKLQAAEQTLERAKQENATAEKAVAEARAKLEKTKKEDK